MEVVREIALITRRLARSPTYAAVTVLTLGLAIGANSAIFSLVNGILLDPLPFSDAERLVAIWHRAPGRGLDRFEQSKSSYLVYRRFARTLEDVGLYERAAVNLRVGSGDPERGEVASFSASVFSTLQVAPAMGRAFTVEDDRPGTTPVVLLSHGLWSRRFGAREVLGSSLRVDGREREIVGVMPRGFSFPDPQVDLWIPLPIDESAPRGGFQANAIARLEEGVAVSEVDRELTELLYRLPEIYPSDMSKAGMERAQMATFVVPLKVELVGDVGTVLWILLGMVGLVLTIACANVANLSLARSEGARREVAVRRALGAGRLDLIKLYLGEALALATMGGLLGLALAYGGLRLLVALGPETLPRLSDVSIDGSVLLYTATISLLCGMVFSALPVVGRRRGDIDASSSAGIREGSVAREGHLVRRLLVAGQVALALVLLVGCSLMARSLFRLRAVDPGFAADPGFDGDEVLTLRFFLPDAEYVETKDVADFAHRLLEATRALPGVRSAATITHLPLSDSEANFAVWIEDHPLEPGELPPAHAVRWVSDGYFRTLGIPLLLGRDFASADLEEHSDSVLVSEAFARHYWPARSAIGRRVRLPGSRQWLTVAGVVGSVREVSLERPPHETVYAPMARRNRYPRWRAVTLAVRAEAHPALLAAPIHDTVASIDPNLAPGQMRTMADLLSRSTARTSFSVAMLVVAAAIGLVLAMVGIYGAVTVLASRRTREIGVRRALGAQPGQVRRMVMLEGLRMAVLGIVVGLGGVLAFSRLLSSLLFEISATDAVTLVTVAVLLVLVAALASYLPARRAATVEPATALRGE